MGAVGAMTRTAGGILVPQSISPSAPVNWNGQRITNLADPAAAQDAATKNYVDSNAVLFHNKGVSGTEYLDVGGLFGPARHGFKWWNGDPTTTVGGSGGKATQSVWAFSMIPSAAFTLANVYASIKTAGVGLTAAGTTTIAAGSNGVDVTTLVGAQNVSVASTAGLSAATNGFVYVTLGNGNLVCIKYASLSGGNTLVNCTTQGGATGSLATNNNVTQVYNSLSVFDSTGAMIGATLDLSNTWGAGATTTAGTTMAITLINGKSLALTAGSLYYLAMITTFATSDTLFWAWQTNGNMLNVGTSAGLITAPANYRAGRAATGATSMPGSITPSSLTSTNTSAPGMPWLAAA